jgi:hypothetical protein
MDKAELINDMDDLWNNFLQVRATHPYMRPTHIGLTSYESAPYYKIKGLNFKVQFDKPLTKEDIERLNGLGYWVNQSVIVRLYALLEYYGVVSKKRKINIEFEGHEEVDILRRLRKYFAHTGHYNETDREQKKIFDRIVTHFKLKSYDTDRFPISIDTVIEVIYKGTKRYIEQILSQPPDTN